MDPDVPLVVSEVNPHALDPPAEGHRRQPELHDDGGHAGAQAARRRGRAAAARRQHLPGGVAAPAWPAWTSSTSRSARWSTAPTGLTHDGDAVEFPAPAQVRPARSPSTSIPFAGKVARRRLRRDRRGAEAPQREPQDPRAPRPARVGHVRAGAGVHRPLAVDQRRVRAADQPGPGAPRCWPRRPGVELDRRPHAAAGRRRRPELRRPHPPATRACPTAGLALFVSNDNLRKGAALNAVQIAELVAAEAG